MTTELREQMARIREVDELIRANLEDIGYGG